MVGHSLFALALYAVGFLAGIDEFFHTRLYLLGALGYLANDFHVACREPGPLLTAEDVEHALYILGQSALVVSGHGDDMIHREVAHHARLYLYLLGVGFPFHLVAGAEFVLFHHARRLEHADALSIEIAIEAHGTAGLAVESPLTGFGLPLVAVAVAVEADGTTDLDVFPDDVDDGTRPVFTAGDERIHAPLEVGESFGHSRVEHDERTGTVGLRAHGTKLEAVAREGERRRAVAVGVVNHQFGNLRNVEFHTFLSGHGEEFVLVSLLDVVEQVGELLAQEAGDDGRRSLVGPEPMVVGGTHHRGLEQSVVAIDGHQCLHDEHHEA